jgi:hypothetical protein
MKTKKFLDSVHGFISVPDEYCKRFVDTENFQRLRRIEQMSARSLFPSAHHDRFIHSIGVYHIGCKIVESISRKKADIDESLIESYKIACLMHDCAHSPFSHTFEHLFGGKDELFGDYQNITEKKDPEIKAIDVNDIGTKQHEIISAILCVTLYRESIETAEHHPIPELIGRMIMGAKYGTKERSIEDCFIELLHGFIDADRLDYICRDKWAAGYMSSSVDVDRLIDSIELFEIEGYWKVTFGKNALTEIQSVIDAKNFQNTCMFNHHQVKYEQWLLKKCVEELVQVVCGGKDGDPKRIFNYKAFMEPQAIDENTNIYLPSDDDLIHLMKSHYKDIPHFREWQSRTYDYYPLWKSRAEFIAIFEELDGVKLLQLSKPDIYAEIEKILKSEGYECMQDMFAANTELTRIEEEDEIYIKIGNKAINYVKLNIPTLQDVYCDESFKYVFVKNDYLGQKDEIISKIKGFLAELLKSVAV